MIDTRDKLLVSVEHLMIDTRQTHGISGAYYDRYQKETFGIIGADNDRQRQTLRVEKLIMIRTFCQTASLVATTPIMRHLDSLKVTIQLSRLIISSLMVDKPTKFLSTNCFF